MDLGKIKLEKNKSTVTTESDLLVQLKEFKEENDNLVLENEKLSKQLQESKKQVIVRIRTARDHTLFLSKPRLMNLC